MDELTALEERITRAEFARRVGVNRKTVTRWIQNGRLTLGEDGLLDFERANRERLATESPLAKHQARKRQFEEARQAALAAAQRAAEAPGAVLSPVDPERATAPATPAPLDATASPEDLGRALKLETYRLQKAKAEQANLELDKAAGLLVERTEVDFVLRDVGNTLRGLLEGLPDRLAPVLAGHQGDVAGMHKLIDDAARELLEAIADHMTRKLDEVTR